MRVSTPLLVLSLLAPLPRADAAVVSGRVASGGGMPVVAAVSGDMPRYGAAQWQGFIAELRKGSLPDPAGIGSRIRDLPAAEAEAIEPRAAAAMMPMFKAYLSAAAVADEAKRKEAFSGAMDEQKRRLQDVARQEIAELKGLLRPGAQPGLEDMRDGVARLKTLEMFSGYLSDLAAVDRDLRAGLPLPALPAHLPLRQVVAAMHGALRGRVQEAASARVESRAKEIAEALAGADEDALVAVGRIAPASSVRTESNRDILDALTQGLRPEDRSSWPEFVAAVRAGKLVGVRADGLDPVESAALLPAFRAYLSARRISSGEVVIDQEEFGKTMESVVLEAQGLAWREVNSAVSLGSRSLRELGERQRELAEQAARLRAIQALVGAYLPSTTWFSREAALGLGMKAESSYGTMLPMARAVDAAYELTLRRLSTVIQDESPRRDMRGSAPIIRELERSSEDAVLLMVGSLFPYMAPVSEQVRPRPSGLAPATPRNREPRRNPPDPAERTPRARPTSLPSAGTSGTPMNPFDEFLGGPVRRFISDRGLQLRHIPGVKDVRASRVQIGAATGRGIVMDVSADADWAAIEAALQPWRKYGVAFQVFSGPFLIYSIDSSGNAFQGTPLDKRMALHEPGRGLWDEVSGGPADRFLKKHGEALKAIPGIVRAAKEDLVHMGSLASYKRRAVVLEAAPGADMAAIKAALEPYRFAGIMISVSADAASVILDGEGHLFESGEVSWSRR